MVKRILSYIQQTEVIQSASVLVGGTLVAQAIPIALQPFLRRYFDPADFGYYSIYISIIGILMVISSLRYEQAIVLPKADSDSVKLVNISLSISLIFSIILVVIALLFHTSILKILSLPKDRRYILFLVPLGTFLFSIFQVYNYWLIRKKKFKSISVNKFSRRAVEGVSQSTFAIAKYSGGLILGDVIGQLVNAVVSFYQSVKCGYRLQFVNPKDAGRLLREYAVFPKVNLLPALMSTICFMLPVVFINKYYSAEEAGYFDLSKLILSVPLALVASSFSSVVLNKTADCYRNKKPFIGEIKPLIWIVLAMSLLEVLIIVLWSESLFTVIFGDKWLVSGEISKLLVFPYALNFITSSFTSLFVALNKITWQSVWQVFYFLMISTLPFLSGLSFENFIFAYTTIEVVANSTMIVLLILLVKNTNEARD